MNTKTLLFVFLWPIALQCCKHPLQVGLLVNTPSDNLSILAAKELESHLSAIYPDYLFIINKKCRTNINLIIDTSLSVKKDACKIVVENKPNPGVKIIGGSPSGLLCGTYDFLTWQGYTFLLSHTILPHPKKNFAPKDTVIENHALANKRMVFNWHNFLSGCTGWDLQEYKNWIDQCRRMKYNTIMLHAYGNNPMYQFSHNQQTKPVGYIANSVRGRDWGIAHVNDVRRLTGGKLFNDSIFGAAITKVPNKKHAQATKELMQQVFAYAAQNGMQVCFALDIDTDAANPQNIIETLPDSAKFEVNGRYCARPDTREGYLYYKAQVLALQQAYPHINLLTLWFRRNAGLQALWREITKDQLPAPWLKEFEQIENSLPKVEKYEGTHASDFAISKIALAIENICKEIGFNVEIAIGSWDYKFIPSCDLIYPARFPFVALDYFIKYDAPGTQAFFATKKTGRNIIPIIWAHHDDFTYMGRPYVPFANFADINQLRNVTDFGIIHWTTRPLDLYFSNIANQVWHNTANETYLTTCNNFSCAIMPANEHFAAYVYQWHTQGPQFGRETLDYLMHHKLKVNHDEITKCQKRLTILDSIDTATITPTGADYYRYFKGFEKFCISFLSNQLLLDSANNLLENNNIEQSLAVIRQASPEESVALYVQAIQAGTTTRGEEALLLSMNLRWLPDFISLKQQLGQTPVFVNFQPTRYETLAQAPGKFTFFIDHEGNWWLAAGEKETGCKAAQANLSPETSNTYIVVDSTLNMQLTTIRRKPLLPGKYKLTLLTSNPNNMQVELYSNNEAIAYKVHGNNLLFTLPQEGLSMAVSPITNSLQLYSLKIETVKLKSP
ncbi:MAG: hypothetical protein HC896_19135 [Bacteroidales bacterium]|nr:hypothetical protein [Bacteroidales bacterium]